MATTYYVEPGVGNDGNAGTNWGAGNSWATFQKAADTATAGDTVYLKGAGTNAAESLAATIDFDQATCAGTNADGYVRFIGTNSSGVVDGSRYVVDFGSNAVHGFTLAATADLLWFENIEIRHAGSGKMGITASATVTGCIFLNCWIHGCGSHGWSTANMSYCYFIRCGADCNGGSGFVGSAGSVYLFCCSTGNTASGFLYCMNITGCVAHANTGNNITFSATLPGFALNCVADGGSADGIANTAGTALIASVVIGCRITNNSASGTKYGLNCAADPCVYGWNYFKDNGDAQADDVYDDAIAKIIPSGYSGGNPVDSNVYSTSESDDGYVDQANHDFSTSYNAGDTSRRMAVIIPFS